MVNAKIIDGVGAAAVTFGKLRRAATRMTASIRDTALVVMALCGSAGFEGLDGGAGREAICLDGLDCPDHGTAGISMCCSLRRGGLGRARLIAWLVRRLRRAARPAVSSADDAGPVPSGSKRELKIATK